MVRNFTPGQGVRRLTPEQTKPVTRVYTNRPGSSPRIGAGRCMEKCFKLMRVIETERWFTVNMLMEKMGCARSTAQLYLNEASRYYDILALEKDEIPSFIPKVANLVVYVLEENYEKVVDSLNRV